MKAGAEAHFLAGQIFTLGIAAVAIIPRMPSDEPGTYSIGGKLSHPFRRALVALIVIGIVRVGGCHFHHPHSTFLRAVDGALGTVHVIGQSFLCLTTAYLLECQLSNFINLEGGRPGRSLVPVLISISVLTVGGAILSELVHPNLWCLVNLAEAYSCLPVIKTLKLYASVTTYGSGRNGRGPVLTQTLTVIEYWYLTTSLLSFVGEAMDDVHDDDLSDGTPYQIGLEAIRHNQDNGVDDWTRLVLHSVFLNSIDELQHFTPSSSSAENRSDATTRRETTRPSGDEQPMAQKNEHHSLILRHQKGRDATGVV